MNLITSLLAIIILLVVEMNILVLMDTLYTLENNTAAGTEFTDPTTKLNVVTSVAPVTSIVKNVGGDRIDLAGVVPEGVDSHTFELVPSDVVKLNEADLIVINGLNLEGGIQKVAEESKKRKPELQLLKLGDNTITKDQWIFDFSFPKDKGDPNPHLWLNVLYAMKFANLTMDKLIEMDPNNADYYSYNADKYISKLKKLDNSIMQAVQTVPPQNRKLLTYHDSWAYFGPRYGLTIVGAVQPSDFGEPSPQDVAKLIDQIRSQDIPAIFASDVFPTKVVDQIGKEGNVTVVATLSDDALPGSPSDPKHSYVGMMLENMKHMLVPLGGNLASLEGVDPQDTYSKDG